MASPAAHHLRTRSAALRRAAQAIDDCDVPSLCTRAGDDVWIGPTAMACVEDLAVHALRLAQAAAHLRDVARSLDARASTVESAPEQASR